MSSSGSRLKQLRAVAWLEGVSFLILLLVAMPLKYVAGEAAMVRAVGLIHGLLFALFIITTIQAKIEQDWSGRRLVRVMATALIPFGMVVFDRIVRSPDRRSR